MMKRADETATQPTTDLCVLDASRKTIVSQKILIEYDATALIGLKVLARHAAIEHEDEENSVELPKLPELMATAAIMRCLMPQRLRGWEIKAMRKIMKMTLGDFADRMDGKTAVETISRWESEAQPMGGYAEKVLRLLVCETLRERAPGVSYDGSMISRLKQIDPWRSDPKYELPAIEIEFIKIQKKDTGSIEHAWAA